MKYLKNFAQLFYNHRIKKIVAEKEVLYDQLQKLATENKKLEKKLKRFENPDDILLKYYRIDNVGKDGIPPSYLRPEDKNEYIQRISELESVYRNRAFRELMAWSLNFHANMAVATEKAVNEYGDEVEIGNDNAKYMIAGIRAIWELIVAAHKKDQELTADKTGGYDMLDTIEEESIY